jgi:hypothetical protein
MVKKFLFITSSRNGSGVHPTSYLMSIGTLPPGLKRPGLEADESSPTNAEVKKMWIYEFTSQYVFMM